MRFETLEEWLQWQEQLNPREIDLGLERVRRVWQRLSIDMEPITVITVAGTNGKGSTVALLESILGQAGYRTGSYTSPHLLRYNERIRLDGEPVSDPAILAAFQAIDDARGDTPLTYFEFGTLAALWILARERVEFALLEVGLGGRLDAVNLLDADLAIITSIGLDHQEWLGSDIETIGREKAGIFRPGRPAVFSAPRMPASIERVAAQLGTPLYRHGREFRVEVEGASWRWIGPHSGYGRLPLPGLSGRHQVDNAAGVIMALELLDIPLEKYKLIIGLKSVFLPGRAQRLEIGGVEWWLDVAHNPHAVKVLRQALEAAPVAGATHALVGLLADKPAEAVLEILAPVVDHWHHATLRGSRGREAGSLEAIQPGSLHASVTEGVEALRSQAVPGDRVLVFGSFLTVGKALEALKEALINS